MTPDALIGGRYRLVRELGSGGMSVVWAARDERLDRDVAVKLLRIQSGLSPEDARVGAERAMREARINARLHHPHVVAVFDVVEHEGQPALIMELVPSATLAEALRDHGPVEPTEAARVGSQVASALAAAHGLGIVHRDIKPSNILIGSDGRARISDFGISRAFGDTTLTMTGMINGTPAYLAPEVARGDDSTPAADVFSLGSTLYAAVEGSPPFGTDGNPMALLYRVVECDVPTPQRAGSLAPLLATMLAADPGARPAMDDVTATLSTLSDADAGPAAEDDTGDSTVAVPPPTGARPAMAVIGAGAAAAGTAAGSAADGAASEDRAASEDGTASERTVADEVAAASAEPDPPTAVLQPTDPPTEAHTDAGATPSPVQPTPAVAPAAAPPAGDEGVGRGRRVWIAAAAAVVALIGAVAVATLLWPSTAPSSPVPNRSAVPVESGRSGQQSDGPSADATEAGASERTDSRGSSATDEPSETRSGDERSESGGPTKSSEASKTASETASETASDAASDAASETASEPTETQSGEDDDSGSGGGNDADGDNSDEAGDG